VILPAVNGPATYELAVGGLAIGFLLYLAYFTRNRRRHDRMRRDG
jgi:hypothetical protein